MKARTLHMIGNAHIDPVWLWQWQEGLHEVQASFRSALDRMNEYPDFQFTASSAAFYDWVEQVDPAMFAEIQQRVREERWGIAGGWWIEPDCNIPCGESFARQGLYGQRYFKEKFGIQARTGFNVDSFGHAATLPQILQLSGIENYVFLRPMPHEKELPSHLFWWQAIEGSRVLAFRIPCAYTYWGDDLENHTQACLDETGLETSMCFYGVGNHGGGPTIRHIQKIHQLQSDANFCHRLLFSTPDTFFKEVKTANEAFPVIQEELQHHASGCYAAHSGVKRWNRLAENRLLAAEKWAAVANWVNGQSYPQDFGRAWKNVLFNQFHDIMAGTSLASAYEDARDSYGEALAIADRALTYAVQSLAWQVVTPLDEARTPLIVFNPLTWPVKVPVEMEANRWQPDAVLLDERGQIVPHQGVQSEGTTWRVRLAFLAELPALGYRTFQLAPGAKARDAAPIQADDHFLETDRFRLEIDPGSGNIARLYDRLHQIEVFSGPAARALVLDDPYDTWAHGVFRWHQVVGEFQANQIKLVEHGPVKSVLRVSSCYRASTLIQDFTIYADLDQIDVRVTVDWHEQHKMLKLRFPINLQTATATFEIPYGQIEREANGDEEAFQSWVDVTGVTAGRLYGLSLLNDGKYSLDVQGREAGSEIGLTVLRSPVYAHHDPIELEAGRAYAYIDQGLQHFQYTLLPHAGTWQAAGTVQRAAALNQPPIALFTTFHPGGSLPQSDSFIAVEPDNVIVTVLKQAETGGGIVLRAYESGGMATQAVIQLPKWDRTIRADFKAGEIQTFRIPRTPNQPVQRVNLLEELI